MKYLMLNFLLAKTRVSFRYFCLKNTLAYSSILNLSDGIRHLTIGRKITKIWTFKQSTFYKQGHRKCKGFLDAIQPSAARHAKLPSLFYLYLLGTGRTLSCWVYLSRGMFAAQLDCCTAALKVSRDWQLTSASAREFQSLIVFGK